MSGPATHRPSPYPSPSVTEKAHTLLEQRRVIVGDRHPDQAIVLGDTGNRIVTAWPEGVSCDCPAGANTILTSCAHKVAALVAMTERRRDDAATDGGAG